MTRHGSNNIEPPCRLDRQGGFFVNLRWKPLFFAIFLVSLVVRMVHNSYILKSPLYYLPLGGHVSYLKMAGEIAKGDFLPINGPFSLNHY